VKLETLLPLGKLDPGLRAPDVQLDIGEFAAGAAVVESLGYDAVLVEETKDDPYQLLALGATTTSRLGLGTSVAMAFPRSPTITAMSAWSLQKLSKGRFSLGLGSQVRGHVRRRYGMEWHAPAPWMRDYVLAMRAVWDNWQTGADLNFESEHYNINLMVPLFDPGPIDHPRIPITIAAIGPNMCAVAGEVADGVRLHPVCTPKFIDEEVRPAVARGAARSGKTLSDVDICLKPLVGSAPDEETLAKVAETVRARAAFYLSTPAYRRAWESHDWGDRADEAAKLSKAQKWDDLVKVVDDDMLHTVATIGTFDTIGSQLVDRYEGLIDRIEFSTAVTNPDEHTILAGILAEIRG
jgi:probable F420-dependent oxidoreductase